MKPTPTITSLTGTTGTACLAGNTANLTFSWTDPAGANDKYGYDVSWGDGAHTIVLPATGATSPVSLTHTYGAGGPYTISVTVNDDDSGAGNTVSTPAGFSFVYNSSGLLQPINIAGQRSSFKLGSTVPVKTSVTDCNGVSVSGLTITVHLLRVDGTAEAVNEVTSSSAADTGATMRYSSGQYIFNLSTKLSQFNAGQDLTAGTYLIWLTTTPSVTPLIQAQIDVKK